MKAAQRRRLQFIGRLGKRKGLTIDQLVDNAAKSGIDEEEARALLGEMWPGIPMPDPERDEAALKAAAKLPPTEYNMPAKSKDYL